MCFNQTGDISTVNGCSLKLVDKFTYLGSSVSSTETDIDTRLAKASTAINRLSVIWKSDLTNKMKRSFFQAAVVSILLHGCTTWTLTNGWRKSKATPHKAAENTATYHPSKLDEPDMRDNCWRSRDELISDVLLWTPSDGRAKAGRPARTYIQQLCVDTGCSQENMPEVMNDREGWRERVRQIRADGTRW